MPSCSAPSRPCSRSTPGESELDGVLGWQTQMLSPPLSRLRSVAHPLHARSRGGPGRQIRKPSNLEIGDSMRIDMSGNVKSV